MKTVELELNYTFGSVRIRLCMSVVIQALLHLDKFKRTQTFQFWSNLSYDFIKGQLLLSMAIAVVVLLYSAALQIVESNASKQGVLKLVLVGQKPWQQPSDRYSVHKILLEYTVVFQPSWYVMVAEDC